MSNAIDKATRCQKLLDDPDLLQAFQDVRQALHTRIDELKPSQVDDLVKCKERLFLLDSVEANLRQAITDGKLEVFARNEQEKPPFLGDLLQWHKRKNR